MVRQRNKPRERSRRLWQLAAPAPLLEFSGSVAQLRRPCCNVARLAVAVILSWLATTGVQPAQAQDEIRNFSKTPILVVETGGHHAPVRSLVWLDPLKLLSGGEDKVVKVWDFQDGGRLTQTIRPMIWRGPRGAIYAMAVSPKSDAQGQSLLAVGGYGIEAAGGDLTIFRVPGLVRHPSGDVLKRLVRPQDNNQVAAHTGPVSALAFNPAGTVLASASNDRTVILWDVTKDFAPIRVLRAHNGPIRAMAFSPDGTRLVTGGADGLLAHWNVAQGQAVDNLAVPFPLNTAAYSPDGRFIVVGSENGAIIRVDATNFRGGNSARLRAADQRPVEIVAIHPDGVRLAVSVLSDVVRVPDPMTIACDIELRTVADGNIVRQWPRVHGLVRAMAFSPDGKRLAYAGGTAQGILVQDTAALETSPVELKGKGTSPFDLGFTKDSQVIGFTRDPLTAANVPRVYHGFDLGRRRSRPVTRDQLSGAIKEYVGYTLRNNLTAPRPEAIDANGRVIPFAINPTTERLWWSSTIVPPGPGHPRASVAYGTESGVAVFDLETGRRTRSFAGQSAPVVSVVPSPDGRWLASSSQDQTVMLYPLAGCDTLPALGARFQQRPDGRWMVAEVTPGSPASSMGLKTGDMVKRGGTGSTSEGAKVYSKPEEIAEFVKRVDGLEPLIFLIGINIQRMVSIPDFGPVPLETSLPTTKRDNAALTLLLDTDKEWVVWTPQGYYDTSIEGDTRLLGWHTNPPYQTSRPTDYVPVVTYAGTMNRPDVLERLWRTGELRQALAPVPAAAPPPVAVAAASQPPRIIFASVEGGIRVPASGVFWRVGVARPKVSLRLTVDEGSPQIRERRIILDEKLTTRPPIVSPQVSFTEDVELELAPNRPIRVAVEAVSVDGTSRKESIDVVYTRPPQPPATPPRLFVLGIGTEQLGDPQLPPVKFADKDAGDLAKFVGEHLISADATKPKLENSQVLAGTEASTASITAALDRLHDLVARKQLNKGDIVAIVLAAHVLELKDSTIIATADSQISQAPRTVIPTQDVCDLLGQLTDYGCRVIVFVDGVHNVGDPLISEIKPFVRDLYQKRRVITFVASKEGASDVDVPNEHGLFALGVLQAFQGAGPSGPDGNRSNGYTLDQFKTAVRDAVQNLSGRQQDASCYIPLELPERTLFAKP
jgi:WD40 repeat protein